MKFLNAILPKGITLRITLLTWVVTLTTLGIFVIVIVPEQKREFELSLESKAKGVAVSIRGVAAGAAISEDYSSVVDQAMQVLSGDKAIDYVVVTKNDGFSIVIDRSAWRTEVLPDTWHRNIRTPSSSIGSSKLFPRRVFQYALPFDYSGIQWGWIHIGLSLEAYEGSVQRTYRYTGALSVLCGILSLFISIFYAVRLVRPIRILRSAVEKVARGDLHARANVHSRDEIQDLAEAFNEMSQTILERNQILESVSFAAKQFLSDEDRGKVLGEVLERVGQAAGASRASVLSICHEEGCRTVLQREWLRDGAVARPQGWEAFPWQAEAAAGWVGRLRSGHIVPVLPKDLDQAQRDLVAPEIQSAIFVPIVVVGEWWGLVTFDDFIQQREWGEAEKDSLRALADMLGASIARHRVQTALEEAKATLERRVLERTAELQKQIEAKDRAHAELAATQQRFMKLSREAGMAEVATGVLHNVGNVLNSVNVSATIAAGKISELRADNLIAAVGLLDEHQDDLPFFLSSDPKGVRVIPYLAKLGARIEEDRQVSLKELEHLREHVAHIKQIVATQQNYAKTSGLVEKTSLAELVEDALRIVVPALERHGIVFERQFEDLPEVNVDKHQALQILLNLLRNAKESIKESGNVVRRICLRIGRNGDDRVRIEVHDTGVGLTQDQLTRIFAYGFTTKRDGHGFGLHSGALAAKQMNGSLRAESDGPGLGARFILEFPMSGMSKGGPRDITSLD
jgi:two-component system, NtrC family, sensor kinase